MKKYLTLAASILCGTVLLLCTATAEAGPVHVDLSIGLPLPFFVQSAPVYVQPEPVYIQQRQVVYGNPDYYYGYQQPWREHEWREHHEWRENHDWHEQHWNDRNYSDNRRGERHDHNGYEHHDHGRD